MSKPRLSKSTREFLKMVRRDVLADFEIEQGSKHPRMIITGPKGTRFVTLFSSPSDNRSVANTIRDIRHEARKVGLMK